MQLKKKYGLSAVLRKKYPDMDNFKVNYFFRRSVLRG